MGVYVNESKKNKCYEVNGQQCSWNVTIKDVDTKYSNNSVSLFHVQISVSACGRKRDN